MKRKTIFTALFSAFVACSFVACSNDSDALDINVGTRSIISSSFMTREELQARLNEIGEKYGTRVLIDEDVDVDLVTEDVFAKLEEHLSSKQETKANRINTRAHVVNETSNDSLLMNDSSIDDIMLMAAPPSGETIIYRGSFDHELNISCGVEPNTPTRVLITWQTMSSTVIGSLSLSARIEMGHGSGVLMTYSDPAGTPEAPSFNYSGTIKCFNTILICDTIYKKDDILPDQIYDQIINGEPARFEYHYDDIKSEHNFSGSYPKSN